MNKESILEQVNYEYDISINAIRQKRDTFRDRIKLYNDQNKSHNKISINLVYATVQSMLATTYDDEIIIEFLGRTQADNDIAKMWNNLANFDQEEMGMDILYHKLQKQRALTGVGIRVMNNWNTKTNTPRVSVVDTLCWVPDPKGSYSSNNFRWHGFELQFTKLQLKNDSLYFNVDNILTQEEEETSLKQQEEATNAGLIKQPEKKTKGDNVLCSVYHHYTTINGKKYWIALANNRTLLVGFKEIEAVLDAEKKDPSIIPFPITLNYFDPEEGSPYGNSLVDLLEDKQRAQSKFANLMMKKAIREGLGNDIIYDRNLIPNRTDLIKDTEGPKLIGVDGKRGNIDGVMREVQKGTIPVSNFNMFDFIQSNAFLATGLDARSLGVGTQQNITATEAQQIQANANLRMILLNKVNFRGEKEFWRLWYREYKANFKNKKYIRIKNGLGIRPIEVTQDKFETQIDPDIVIKSKAEMLTDNKQKANNLMALLPLIQQNQTIPEISKRFYLRKILKNNGVDDEMIQIYVPYTADEARAYEDLYDLNEDKLRDPLIGSMDEDHLTYIIIYQQALDTRARSIAIQARRDAYIESQKGGGNMPMEQGVTPKDDGEQVRNMATSQLFSNATSQQANKTPISMQDIQ